MRVAGQGKLSEGFFRRAGKCVEGVCFAILSLDIVKECTELRSAEFNAGIGDDLDQALQIELSANRDAGLIQNFEGVRFLRNSATRVSRVSFTDSNLASSCFRSLMS